MIQLSVSDDFRQAVRANWDDPEKIKEMTFDYTRGLMADVLAKEGIDISEQYHLDVTADHFIALDFAITEFHDDGETADMFLEHFEQKFLNRAITAAIELIMLDPYLPDEDDTLEGDKADQA